MEVQWRGKHKPGRGQGTITWNSQLSALIWGDNREVLLGLCGSGVRFAYLDPPFKTGDAFYLGDKVAFRDDLDEDGYLQMLYECLHLVKEALAPNGTLVLHLDQHVSHAAKLVLDEVFGRFLNEIIWSYQGGALTSVRKHLPRKHDTLFWYANGSSHVFNQPRTLAVSVQMRRRWGHYAAADGTVSFGRIRHEGQTHARLRRRFVKQHGREPFDGDLAFRLGGSLLRSVWVDIPEIRNSPRYQESTGYPTQKPLALLERLIAMATEPGDLVLDPFCGSGTTLIAADKLGRRWIGIDRGRPAIEIAGKRLSKHPYTYLEKGTDAVWCGLIRNGARADSTDAANEDLKQGYWA